MNNDNTLSAKLTRIETAVGRIRTKTDTSTDTIENVASAVEDLVAPEGNINITNTSSTDVSQYATAQVVDSNLVAGNIKKDTTILGVTGSYEGSGGGGSTNIYRVESLEEMGEIDNPQDDDMCVVYTNSVRPIQEDDVLTSVSFPNEVTLPKVLQDSDEYQLNFRINPEYSGHCNIMCNLTYQQFRFDMMGEEYYSISFTSQDGQHYSKSEGEASITFPDTVTIGYFNPDDALDILGLFIQTGGISFPGMFTYNASEEDWLNSDIGINVDTDKVFNTQDVYGNNGTVTGTFDRTKHKRMNFTVSTTTPTDKSTFWFKPKTYLDGSDASSFSSKIDNYAFDNLPIEEVSKYVNTSTYAVASGNTGTNTGNARHGTAIVGDYFYVFPGNDKQGFKINMSTNAKTSFNRVPFNSSVHSCIAYDSYVYFLSDRYGTSSYKFNTSSNSYTSFSTPQGIGSGTLNSAFRGIPIFYDGKIYTISRKLDKECVYTISGASTTVKNIPSITDITQGTYDNTYALYVEDTYVYLYISSTSGTNGGIIKYNFVDNTVDYAGVIPIGYYRDYTGDTALSKTLDFIGQYFEDFYSWRGIGWNIPTLVGNSIISLCENSSSASTGSPGVNRVHRINLNALKSIIAQNKPELFLINRLYSVDFVCLSNNILHNGQIKDSYIWCYCFNTDKVYKLPLDVLNYTFPTKNYTCIIFDTSKPSFKLSLYEDHFEYINNVYLISDRKVILGELYVYDPIGNSYSKMIMNPDALNS